MSVFLLLITFFKIYCALGSGPVETRTGDLVIQEDTIFISGMNTRTTEEEIKDHFGAIGLIKVGM